MPKSKRPVYLVVRYEDLDNEEGPFTLIAIKQTALAADIEAGKHANAKVKKGFVTTD